MTGSSPPPAAPGPGRTASEFDSAYRQMYVREYMWANRDRFTEEALSSAAQAAGYTPDEIATALRSVAKRRADEAAAKPVKARARQYVLAAYGITFLVFAIAFLRPSATDAMYDRGMGPVALGVLGFTMVIALLLGLLWVARRRPSADQAENALGVMLAVPFVLLVAIAGLCVATTRPLIFGSAA